MNRTSWCRMAVELNVEDGVVRLRERDRERELLNVERGEELLGE